MGTQELYCGDGEPRDVSAVHILTSCSQFLLLTVRFMPDRLNAIVRAMMEVADIFAYYGTGGSGSSSESFAETKDANTFRQRNVSRKSVKEFNLVSKIVMLCEIKTSFFFHRSIDRCCCSCCCHFHLVRSIAERSHPDLSFINPETGQPDYCAHHSCMNF